MILLASTERTQQETIEADEFSVETQGSAPTAVHFYYFALNGKIVASMPVDRVLAVIDTSAKR